MRSVETHGVDIDLDAQIAGRAFGGIQPEADIAAEVEILGTLDEKPHAMATFECRGCTPITKSWSGVVV